MDDMDYYKLELILTHVRKKRFGSFGQKLSHHSFMDNTERVATILEKFLKELKNEGIELLKK